MATPQVTSEEAPKKVEEGSSIVERDPNFQYVLVERVPKFADEGHDQLEVYLRMGFVVDEAETKHLAGANRFWVKKKKADIDAKIEENLDEWRELTHGPMGVSDRVFEVDENSEDPGFRAKKSGGAAPAPLGKISLTD